MPRRSSSLSRGRNIPAKMAQRQKATIRKKSMTFPRPRRQAEVRSRTQNPCGSLWRLWWMQAPFPLSPLTTLSCPFFMTVRRKLPLSAGDFPSRSCSWAWRRRQRRRSLISSTTRAGTALILNPTVWRI